MLHWRTRIAVAGLTIAAALGGLLDGWSWL